MEVKPIPKGAKTQLNISVSDFKGKTYLNLRDYVLTGEDFIPTKKGVTLEIEKLPLLIKKLSLIQSKQEKTNVPSK